MTKLRNNIYLIVPLFVLVSCASNNPRTIYGHELTSTGLCENSHYKQEDNEAVPCMIKQPRYPRSAVINGVQGSVTFTFSVSESGKPINIKVVNSEPEGVFDKDAGEAISQWSFKPKTVNGIAVKQDDMTYEMVFKLGN